MKSPATLFAYRTLARTDHKTTRVAPSKRKKYAFLRRLWEKLNRRESKVF